MSTASTLTLEQAQAIVATLPGDFARSISSVARPTEKQAFWIFKLASEATRPKASQTALPADLCEAVATLFATASGVLQAPKVRLANPDGNGITLKAKSGVVYVSDARRTRWSDNWGREVPVFYGKIEGATLTSPAGGTPEWALELIRAFADDPVGTATAYGRITGSCCFCGRHLTKEESVGRGFGPVCASRYGLL